MTTLMRQTRNAPGPSELDATPFPIQRADPEGCFDQWLEALSLSPLCAEIETIPAGAALDERSRPHGTWYWVARGDGVGCIEATERFDFGKGSLVIVPAHHRLRWSCDGPVSWVRVSFTSRLYALADALAPMGLSGHYASRMDSPMGGLSHRLVRELAVRGPGWRSIASALLLDGVAYVVRHYPTCSCKLASERLSPLLDQLQPAFDYLESHLREPKLPVVTLAAAAGVSEGHFRRLFKQLTGVTPNAYLRRCRVERACHLLTTTRLELGDIAARCGFTDRHFFHQVFRKHVGTTPGRYRRGERLQLHSRHEWSPSLHGNAVRER